MGTNMELRFIQLQVDYLPYKPNAKLQGVSPINMPSNH